MPEARPLFGEEPNPDEPSVPRAAATVILVRDAAGPVELLLAQRTRRARFMAGAWVFPGGAVEPGDGDGTDEDTLRAAGVRELREEAAITLPDPAALVAISRWITPPESRIRYDTWFFAAIAPAGQTPEVDGSEIVDWRWIAPRVALERCAAKEMLIAFPTVRHLELVDRFASGEALIAHARDQVIEPVRPRIAGSGEQARIVMPGEPGYD